jgi:hypothetical protein
MANGKRMMLLTAEHMQRIIHEKASTPFGQRSLLNTLRAMFGWAVSEGRVTGHAEGSRPGRVMNTELANQGDRLANSAPKSLRTKDAKMHMVVDAVLIEPVCPEIPV